MKCYLKGKLTDRKPKGILIDITNNGLMTSRKFHGTLVCGALVSEPRYYGFDDLYYGYDGQYYGFYEMAGYVK